MRPELKILEPGRLEYGNKTYDTFEFDRCLDFYYEVQIDGTVACELTIAREDGSVLQLGLEGVTHIRLPELAPLFWISELQVVDARNYQLEGVRYVVASENGFVCNCQGVRLSDAQPR
jgi:hypothetical protein